MADRELKYICSPWSDRLVVASLSGRCRVDAKFQSNVVNSVYFDTLNWAFADEKAASDYLKTKVRIRWYGASDADQSEVETASAVFLEVKQKIGSTRSKQRSRLTMSPSEVLAMLKKPVVPPFIRAEISRLAPNLSNVDLFPRVHVKYLRRRYVDSLTGARIAFDSAIHCNAVGFAPSERHTALLDQSVLEVKGKEQDKPVNLRYLNAPYLRKAAFSKYYECYCQLTRYQQ